MIPPGTGVSAPVGLTADALQVAEEEGARRDALSKKADVSEVYRVLEKKSDIAHVEEALRHKADSSTVAVLAERNEMSSDVAGRLILLKEEMVQKANVKVCTSVRKLERRVHLSCTC